MFEKDAWLEIFAAIKQNKLRTFLTAFSVGWGIFILIILLGAGNGLTNGAQAQFAGDAVNSIFVEAGKTTIAQNGYKVGREIKLTNEDFELIAKRIPALGYKTANHTRNQMHNVIYGKEKGNYLCRPCLPGNYFLENASMVSGRFLNETDLSDYRKVCVVGLSMAEVFFKKENPIGKYLNIDGTFFKVVGTFKDVNRSEMLRAYLPLTTAQRVFNYKNNIDLMWLGLGDLTLEESEQVSEEIRKILAKKYNFSRSDRNALFVNNLYAEYKKIMNLLSGIKLFVLIIGIMTLIAGIVGVSNIMIIVVKERTREIGIRKAIGASPQSIVGLILQESVLITSLAGFTGLVVASGILYLVNSIGIDSDFFRQPHVDMEVAIFATLLIIVAGAIAGLVPAIKAAKIHPIEALRSY